MDNQAMAMMSCQLDSNLNITGDQAASLLNQTATSGITGQLQANMIYTESSKPLTSWTYWQDYYYPQVIRESYPVYIKERAEDKGKQSYEIIKALKDKRLMKLDTVSDFIEAMDTLLKIL